MSSNRSRQSQSFSERRRRRRIVGTVSGAVAVVAWGFVLSRLSFMNGLMIETVDVYAAPDLQPAIQAAALQAVQGTYGHLFSRTNTLIYPKADVIAAVSSTSPRIESVKVSREGLHGLSISISEKAPAAVICAGLPDVDVDPSVIGDDCYLADSDAYMYRAAKGEPDAASRMRFYIPSIDDDAALGHQATSTAAFRRLSELVRSLETAGISVHSMLIDDDGSYEIYADNPGGSSLVVIQMNERAGLDIERDNLVAFWNRMIADAHATGTKPAWSEIRLQFPPNVYSRPMEARSDRR
jgi:hypothetical protein